MLTRTVVRGFGKFKEAKLPDLKFGYDELQPVFSAQLMALHHSKHHQAYVNNYNATAEAFLNAESQGDSQEMLRLAPILSFNAGGHFNHSFFWENLAPANKEGGNFNGQSALGKLILEKFESLENFQAKFNAKAAGVRGSGWGWLAYEPTTNQLILAETYNQETLSQQGLKPLLTVDVWEHAFYVDYLNEKPRYLSNIWEIINWEVVEQRFNKVSK